MCGLTTCGRDGKLYKRECVERCASLEANERCELGCSQRSTQVTAHPTTGTVDLDSLVYVYVKKVREIHVVATW